MYAPVFKRDFSEKRRDTLADSGKAMPDGSFPIVNTSDLKNAIALVGRAKNPEAAKAHIIARAKALNAVGLLPDTWNVQKGYREMLKDDMVPADIPSKNPDQAPKKKRRIEGIDY